MADIVYTDTNVLRYGNGGVYRTVQYGEAITAGQAVYESTTDQKFYKADATDPLKPATTTQLAIAVTTGSVDQQGVVARANAQLDFGANVLTPAEVYVVSSAAPGGIAPVADLAIGSDLSIIGYALNDQVLNFSMNVTNVAKV